MWWFNNAVFGCRGGYFFGGDVDQCEKKGGFDIEIGGTNVHLGHFFSSSTGGNDGIGLNGRVGGNAGSDLCDEMGEIDVVDVVGFSGRHYFWLWEQTAAVEC